MQPDERRITDARVIRWSGDLYGVALTFITAASQPYR